MAFATEASHFAEQIAGARAAAGPRPIWARIGSYRLSATETIDNIVTARRLGADGIVLFSYDNLIKTPQTPSDYLAVVARAAFTSPPPPIAGSR